MYKCSQFLRNLIFCRKHILDVQRSSSNSLRIWKVLSRKRPATKKSFTRNTVSEQLTLGSSAAFCTISDKSLSRISRSSLNGGSNVSLPPSIFSWTITIWKKGTKVTLFRQDTMRSSSTTRAQQGHAAIVMWARVKDVRREKRSLSSSACLNPSHHFSLYFEPF